MSHTLYYVLSGELELKAGKEHLVCEENCIIHLSDLEEAVLTNPSASQKASFYYIMYTMDSTASSSECCVPKITKDKAGSLLSAVKSIYKTYLAQSFGYRLKLFGETALLLSELTTSGTSPRGEAGADHRLLKAVEYIRMNYYKTIPLSTLSAIAGYSVSHFRRLFVASYGVSPQEYMINYKIRKAGEFLADDRSKTIDEVAELVGMCNASYFCKMFKKRTGMSPHKYILERPSFLQFP